MPMTCAAAFSPKAWTCAAALRKPRFRIASSEGFSRPGAALYTALFKPSRPFCRFKAGCLAIGPSRLSTTTSNLFICEGFG